MNPDLAGLAGLSPGQLVVVALIGLPLPLLSALISRVHWDPAVTGLITGALSAAGGFVVEAIKSGADFDPRAAAATALAMWLFAVVIGQRGILAGTNLEARALDVGSKDDDPGEDPGIGVDFDGNDADDELTAAAADDPGQPPAGAPPAATPDSSAPTSPPPRPGLSRVEQGAPPFFPPSA